MAGKAPIHDRATEIKEVTRRFADANAFAFLPGRFCVSAGRYVQNKANSRMARLGLTAGQEESYVKRHERCVRENKANLAWRSVKCEVSSVKSETSRVEVSDLKRHTSNLKLPPCKTKPISGGQGCERQCDGSNGCGRHAAAVPRWPALRVRPVTQCRPHPFESADDTLREASGYCSRLSRPVSGFGRDDYGNGQPVTLATCRQSEKCAWGVRKGRAGGNPSGTFFAD